MKKIFQRIFNPFSIKFPPSTTPTPVLANTPPPLPSNYRVETRSPIFPRFSPTVSSPRRDRVTVRSRVPRQGAEDSRERRYIEPGARGRRTQSYPRSLPRPRRRSARAPVTFSTGKWRGGRLLTRHPSIGRTTDVTRRDLPRLSQPGSLRFSHRSRPAFFPPRREIAPAKRPRKRAYK